MQSRATLVERLKGKVFARAMGLSARRYDSGLNSRYQIPGTSSLSHRTIRAQKTNTVHLWGDGGGGVKWEGVQG